MLKDFITHHLVKDVLWIALVCAIIYGTTHNSIVRPVPQPTEGSWSIQLMQHPLLFGFAGHNYIALRDGDGSIISELHGLATEKETKQWKYVGSKKTDLLQVWEFNHGKYLAPKSLPGIILTEGKEEDMVALWNEAKLCEAPINTQNIPYPPYGVSLRNETINSNSVAYTLAQCMHLDTHHVGIWTPGSTMNLLDR